MCVILITLSHNYYTRRRLANGEDIMSHGVRPSRCVCVRRISLDGEVNVLQGRLQRGKWTQLASSLAQGGKEFHPQRGKNSPRYMGHIDDCILSSCH